MMQRPVSVRLAAANDNIVTAHRAPRSTQDLLRVPFIPRPPGATLDPSRSPAVPMRMGVRPLAILALSGLLLLALLSAFLLGLALVGVLAGAVTGVELVRRHRRAGRLVACDRPIAG